MQMNLLNQDNTKLSIILCSRNDNYMGNSIWRLQTSLNYTAQNISELGKESEVEIIVADWGSERPLREVLRLNHAAARITYFLEIPPEVAKKERKDSPFPEVLALNAAARCAHGEYIGRLDQDTIVGKRFLEKFFQITNKPSTLDFDLEMAFLFSARRGIPYKFVSKYPSFNTIFVFVELTKRLLPVDGYNHKPWFHAYTGILLISRKLWHECGGYDERLIYWGVMDADMAYRISKRYKLVNLGELVNYDFYHLEHVKTRGKYWRGGTVATGRKINPRSKTNPFCANGPDWGFIRYHLKLSPYPSPKNEEKLRPRMRFQIFFSDFLTFYLGLVSLSVQKARIALSLLKKRYIKTANSP